MISVTGGRIKHRKGRWSANWRIFSTQTWPVPTGDCGPSSSNMLSKWRLFETLQKPRKRWGLGRKEGGKGGATRGVMGGKGEHYSQSAEWLRGCRHFLTLSQILSSPTVHFLTKDLSFKHRGASNTGGHQTCFLSRARYAAGWGW